MGRWRLKSPASPFFTQPFIQAQIKETIKDEKSLNPNLAASRLHEILRQDARPLSE